MAEKKPRWAYRALRALVRACYPAMEIVGRENLPSGAAILVGNHAQIHGPIACELFFPRDRYTWCAGEMMRLREVPAYAYRDFWFCKPRWSRWLYRLCSYLIAPLSVLVFNNANTIPVYHDLRAVTTFRTTLKRLREGAKIVIFPEHDADHNQILCDFQERFVDVARMYERQTGQALDFVPMYIAPALKKICLGPPVRLNAQGEAEAERHRVCQALMTAITDMACALPRHRVVHYRNGPKRGYPYNIPGEQAPEKAGDSTQPGQEKGTARPEGAAEKRGGA